MGGGGLMVIPILRCYVTSKEINLKGLSNQTQFGNFFQINSFFHTSVCICVETIP